ncbi:MAG TPA: adventurous gliding motility protein CglF [Pseudomonadota bacterium]|nr:adventurous gliding motility protein CglF [Pseudomonadota bacterium]
MRKLTWALALLLSVGVAHAQDPAAGGAAGAVGPGAAAGGASGVQYKQKTTYDFDDDTVEGDLVRPDGEMIDSRHKAKHSSLIKMRENFIPEMLKSVEFL